MSFSSVAETGSRVLVIHSYHTENPWVTDIKQGIQEEFQSFQEEVELYHEFMDAKRYPQAHKQGEFLRHLASKYDQTPLDLIIVSDDPALQTLLHHRAEYFPQLPIVYLGVNHISPQLLATELTTGVFENHAIEETLLEIKKQTQTDRIIVISNATESGQANEEKIKQLMREQKISGNILVLNNLSPDTLISRFSQLSPTTPVLVTGQLNGNHGGYIGWQQTFKLIQQKLPNPIYSFSYMALDYGAVGVHYISALQHGQKAASYAKQLLLGTPIEQLPPEKKALNLWTFDAPQLVKHGISISALPPGSELINQKGKFYRENQQLLNSILGAFILALAIIVILSAAIRRVMLAKRIIEENESRYRDLATTGANIFWETNASGELLHISGETEQAYQQAASQMLGRPLISLIANQPEIEFPVLEFKARFRAKAKIEKLNFKVTQGGELKIFQLSGKPYYSKRGEFRGYRGITREITQEYQLSETIAYQASYDALTGLVNRSEFNLHLKQLTKRVDFEEAPSFLCFLDLDRFKLVNDTAGHLVGDRMLTEIAQLISANIRNHDILGRLGGDEFGLLLLHASLDEAKEICSRILKQVERHRFEWEGRIFEVGVSIGMIAIESGLNEEELLSRSDLACYRAKEQGRGRIYIVDEDKGEFDLAHLQMGYIANVTQAIEQNRFSLAKQRIEATVPDSSGSHHYELLLRYSDEHGNAVSPADFIPFAEKHGVITMIDRWVLETAINGYPEHFPDQSTQISINLSGISISNDEFVRFAEQVVQNAPMEPNLICFEITETAAISHLPQALSFIQSMKKLGVKFALDDFGCGSSSFGYLKNLPVDYVKIDGSLIKNIVTEASDRAIVTAVHSIAEMMQMKTIAEFVEDDEIRTILKEIGVHYVQGYGIGKPEPVRPAAAAKKVSAQEKASVLRG